jgi:hypothetical protein
MDEIRSKHLGLDITPHEYDYFKSYSGFISYIYTSFMYINLFFEKLLIIRQNVYILLHILQHLTIYLWSHMYIYNNGQPRPKHAIFNVINLMIYWYI